MIDQWNIKMVCGLLVHEVQPRECTAGTKRRVGEREEEEGRAFIVSGQLFTRITQIPPPESGISTPNSS